MINPSDLDIKGRLKVHFPEFFELLDGNDLNWDKVNECFARKGNEYHAKYELTGQTFEIEASLFNVITESLKGKLDAQRLFQYIRNLYAELVDCTTRAERTEITPALYGMLTNVDMKYQNFLGELSVLNLLKRRMPLTLLETERPLISSEPEGTKIDFHFINQDTQESWLIEIVNLRLDEDNVSSDRSIKNQLRYKIKRKLLKTGINRSKEFMLVPVVWGNWDHILKLVEYYERVKPQFENTITPVCFIPFTDQYNNPVYRFGTIDTIFEGSKIISK